MKPFFTILFSVFLIISTSGDTFTFRADNMSGGKATGREITVLTGNAEVRSACRQSIPSGRKDRNFREQ